jgi:putative transposase
MPRGLYRIHHTGLSHFVTFSCYRRQSFFHCSGTYDLFLICLERMRRHFQTRVYGYVVMPEHVHLLMSEPEKDNMADSLHFLKLSFTKRLRSQVSAQRRARTWGTFQVPFGKNAITIATFAATRNSSRHSSISTEIR